MCVRYTVRHCKATFLSTAPDSKFTFVYKYLVKQTSQNNYAFPPVCFIICWDWVKNIVLAIKLRNLSGNFYEIKKFRSSNLSKLPNWYFDFGTGLVHWVTVLSVTCWWAGCPMVTDTTLSWSWWSQTWRSTCSTTSASSSGPSWSTTTKSKFYTTLLSFYYQNFISLQIE